MIPLTHRSYQTGPTGSSSISVTHTKTNQRINLKFSRLSALVSFLPWYSIWCRWSVGRVCSCATTSQKRRSESFGTRSKPIVFLVQEMKKQMVDVNACRQRVKRVHRHGNAFRFFLSCRFPANCGLKKKKKKQFKIKKGYQPFRW